MFSIGTTMGLPMGGAMLCNLFLNKNHAHDKIKKTKLKTIAIKN
jgi:hypothetical protein